MMTESFIARERDCSELQRCLDSGRSELAIVYGRRRVGKTFLIERFFNDKYDFKFVGARNLSTRTQLTNFTRTLKKYAARNVKTLSNWSDAFYALEDYLETIGNKKASISVSYRKSLIGTKIPPFFRKSGHFGLIHAFFPDILSRLGTFALCHTMYSID